VSTASFALPVCGAERETAAGWARWRAGRGVFVPAPVMDIDRYRSLDAAEQARHDLHRAVTHANLPILETPMSAAVARTVWMRIQSNALKAGPATRAGLMISGGGYQGKTETVCEVAARFEEQWLDLHRHLNPTSMPGTRDLHAPVAYVQTPVTATPKSICAAILHFYGAPIGRVATLPQLVHAVRTSLRDHGTKVLILDDITRLRMHREADQDALDLVRSLMAMDVTLVLVGVGIRASGLLGDGTGSRQPGGQLATQTRRRFDLVELDRFGYDTATRISAWIAHLAGLQTHLRLLRATPGMLTTGVMPEYLFRRTGGVVGLLERLIEDACAAAIDSGTETITIGLLENLDLDLGGHPGRDARAGEIPEVATAPRKRGRNTVFDDHGSEPAP
jgi:TniB protein